MANEANGEYRPAKYGEQRSPGPRRRDAPAGRRRRDAPDHRPGHPGFRRPEHPAGRARPSLLEDFHFREKIFHFDHERIPERVVHARGYGAHGYFENYESLADLTRGRPVPAGRASGRRSSSASRPSPAARAPPTLPATCAASPSSSTPSEGNWDLVGNNIPVFFIQDAIKFPDLIHAAKEEPDRGFPQAQTAHDNFWDFASLMPECTHMLMWIMSDRAIPRSFRFMEGFGVHTFRLVNADGQSTFVKFHWKPKHGLQSVVWNEAVKINGADPDFHRRDLWDAIQHGRLPGMGARPSALRRRRSPTASSSTFSTRPRSSPRSRFPSGGRTAGARPAWWTTSSRRPNRWRSAPRTSSPASISPTTRCCRAATSPTSTRNSSGSASPNFTHLPVNAPKCPCAALPAGRPHGDGQPDEPGQLRAQLLGRR